MEVYIERQQNMLSQYIANRPIMGLFLEAERRPGARVVNWWWEQTWMRISVSGRYEGIGELEEVDNLEGQRD